MSRIVLDSGSVNYVEYSVGCICGHCIACNISNFLYVMAFGLVSSELFDVFNYNLS